ncbi:MAG TPA: GAF domain-containing protein [Thermoanaerobaculia bacterium]|nr:GAF domain-containing protein [Thermoanaerobaculia bacterium]
MSAPPELKISSPDERLDALARVSSLLRSGLPAREAMQHLLAEVHAIFPADAYAVWRFHHRTNDWRIVACDGLSRDYADHAVSERRNEGMLADGPVFIADVFASSTAAERHAFYEAEGIRSMFVLPLHLQGEMTGTFVCYYRTPHAIDPHDRQLASVFADVVASVLSARKFDRFAEAARVVSGELDLSRVVQSVTDAATEMTNAQFGAFFYNVLDDAGGSYVLYTISGVPREAFERFPMPRNTAVFGPTFAGTGTVRSDNIRKDPRYGHNAPYHGMPEGHLPVTSYLAVPVVSRSGEVLGGLFFGHSEEGIFTENEEQIVEALAGQAAVAIDNARLYDALQRERERLVRSESRYRALVDITPAHQFIWTTGPDGRLTDDLPAWRELTGQTLEQLSGWGWADVLHPQDRDRIAGAWRDALEARRPMQEQFRVLARDGAYRWIATTSAPVFAEDGSVIEWVGTLADVHDRKTADDNLRFLAQVSDLLASSLDYETTLRTVAKLAVPAIADWCAVDIADEQGGHHRLAVAHVDPAKVELALDLQTRFPPAAENDSVARVIRTGKSEWLPHIPPEMIDSAPLAPEHRAILHSLGLQSFMLVPLRMHDRNLGALTFALSDSRRRFNEADLAFAEELGRRAAVAIENARLYGAAQAANRAKDDFLATLSHELRTPMTAVLGWSRMLKMGLDASETGEAIDAIERSASVQMQLIEDILDMSRIMAGKMRIEAVPVDLCAITQSALGAVHPAADAKEIEIFTSFPREGATVLGDEGRLQQIVWNLLTNAIKFTHRHGQVSVRVTANDETVTLSVRDSGEGIDPAFLPHVFERFRQQDSSTTRAHGGIGLGLAIVRHLVELHGGRITAESEGTGHGSTFTIELPAIRTRRSGTPAAPRATEEMPSLAGISLLVIDDEAMTRDVIAAILRRAGAHVVTADSVRAAHEALAEFTPNVILCDIAMPIDDGYAFLREYRHRGGTSPVIALTAFGRPEDRDKALSSGFNAFLKKPVEPVVLAETVLEMV